MAHDRIFRSIKRLLFSGLLVAPVTEPAMADIKVALAAPITGPIAVGGEQAMRGARKAVDDINMAGGINGEKLLLEIGDDACDPKQAVNLANQLGAKGVRFVAGHMCSGASISASKVYEEEEIMMISPSTTSPKLTDEGGWNIARVCGRDDAQGDVAGRFLASHYAGQRVAIIDDKSAYGKSTATHTRLAMNAAGLHEVMSESIVAGEKDFSALISKLKIAGVKAFYFGGYHQEAGLILRQMEEQGLSARMYAPDTMNTAEVGSIAGSSAGNLFFTFSPDPRSNPGSQAIIESFRRDGRDPEVFTLYTYATFELYRAAAEATDSVDARRISTWLRAGNPVKTVVGEIRLDAKGDVIDPAYVWYTFKEGKPVEVGAID